MGPSVFPPTRAGSRGFLSGQKKRPYDDHQLPGTGGCGPGELKEIHLETNRRNRSACQRGLAGCEPFKLEPAERAEVLKAAKDRNFVSCMNGLSVCDPFWLTAAQASKVSAAVSERNLDQCTRGLPNCDPSRLTGPQLAIVANTYRKRAVRSDSPRNRP